MSKKSLCGKKYLGFEFSFKAGEGVVFLYRMDLSSSHVFLSPVYTNNRNKNRNMKTLTKHPMIIYFWVGFSSC